MLIWSGMGLIISIGVLRVGKSQPTLSHGTLIVLSIHGHNAFFDVKMRPMPLSHWVPFCSGNCYNKEA
jgi:hypothetical protein